MEKNNDPLTALVSSDAKSTDRKKLAELLDPYVVIDQDSKEFGFTPSFDIIDGNDMKVEVLLAGVKARSLLFNLPDGMTSGEVIATGILAEGSAKTSLKRLFDGRKVKKDKDGRYFIPGHLIPELSKRLASR
jgi:hypothetical protein